MGREQKSNKEKKKEPGLTAKEKKAAKKAKKNEKGRMGAGVARFGVRQVVDAPGSEERREDASLLTAGQIDAGARRGLCEAAGQA